MKYLKEQLGFFAPELLPALDEALAVLDSSFRLRFSFSALAIREIVRVLYQSHGLPREATAGEVRSRFQWLPETAFWKDQHGCEHLTRRGELLLSLYRYRRPDEFPESHKTITSSISRLLDSIDQLNKAVHETSISLNMTEADGRGMINRVLKEMEVILQIKRSVFDIINLGTYSESGTVSVSIEEITYERADPESI